MSVLDGLRAFHDPEHGDSSLVEKAYQRFALTQPDGVEITWFTGYRASCRLPVEEARRRYLEDDEVMFCKFSGHELPLAQKMRILARAVWKIENQELATKRPETLPLIRLAWSSEDEQKELEGEQRLWEEILKADPRLSGLVAEFVSLNESDR